MFVYLIYRDTSDFDPSSEVVSVRSTLLKAKIEVEALLDRKVTWEPPRKKASRVWLAKAKPREFEYWIIREKVI